MTANSDATQVLKELQGKQRAQTFSLFISRIREEYLLYLYLIIFVLWAIVIPFFFREPILAFVNNLFHGNG